MKKKRMNFTSFFTLLFFLLLICTPRRRPRWTNNSKSTRSNCSTRKEGEEEIRTSFSFIIRPPSTLDICDSWSSLYCFNSIRLIKKKQNDGMLFMCEIFSFILQFNYLGKNLKILLFFNWSLFVFFLFSYLVVFFLVVEFLFYINVIYMNYLHYYLMIHNLYHHFLMLVMY